MRRLVVVVGLGAAALAGPSFGCSESNREGPDVTCADLECGRINACEEGIIAQCVDGVTVRWHACGSAEVCEASWQVEGQYKCGYESTDCEGCRPERELGCAEGGFGVGGADGGGGSTGG